MGFVRKTALAHGIVLEFGAARSAREPLNDGTPEGMIESAGPPGPNCGGAGSLRAPRWPGVRLKEGRALMA